MGFPIRKCVKCEEEFELRPDKPGFANRCPACSVEDEDEVEGGSEKVSAEMNAARREAMKNLLYRKDS